MNAAAPTFGHMKRESRQDHIRLRRRTWRASARRSAAFPIFGETDFPGIFLETGGAHAEGAKPVSNGRAAYARGVSFWNF
jgi:hypothetical protein